ncbi:MAG: hypothetical protein AB7T22_05995 [Calditrichaceae bacterium]
MIQNMNQLEKELIKLNIDVRRNEPIAPYTTMKVGGNARLFVEAKDNHELETSIMRAHALDVKFFVIGKGSNIIVSDDGFDGLVIYNNTSSWKILDEKTATDGRKHVQSRFDSLSPSMNSNTALSYNEDDAPDRIVRADSGLKLYLFMKTLFEEGITGLQWFAGIPGTVGGAIYMNMHGGHHYFGDLVEKAAVTDGLKTKIVDHDYFQFDYDSSILHETKEVVLWADLRLKAGDVEKARELAKNWSKEKSNQPWRSAGCIFRNLSEEDRIDLDLPTSSMGYVIDQVLHLKGTGKGDAVISESHAAFIENLGDARASDVAALINLVREKAREKLGIELKTEVELIGKF